MRVFKKFASFFILAGVVVALMSCSGDKVSESSLPSSSEIKKEIKQDFDKVSKKLDGKSEALPPAYLKVENFKSCLQTMDHGSWKGWCMPSSKPKTCPDKSWKELQGLSIPACH